MTVNRAASEYGLSARRGAMSPGERAALGRREPARPQYGATAPGFPPPFYPPYGGPPNAWLGAPLISMASRQPPSRQTPISKLAMHTQGAPLVIQNRYDRRKFTTTPEQRNPRPISHAEHMNRDRCEETSEGNRQRNQQQQSRSVRGGRNNNTDAVSVASDESSGSNNSETMLPRIIKPRKRRKKDRKPNNIVQHDLSASNLEMGDCGLINGMARASHGVYEDSYCGEIAMPYRLDVKVLEYPDPSTEKYRVSALGEALEATRFGLAEAASPAESAVSSCQCRYCDPVGQIWDADSIADLLNENTSIDFAPTKLEDSMKVVGPMGRKGDATLRRSWSDPSSHAPTMRKDVNNAETFSAPNLYSLFPPTRRASSSYDEPRSPLALEISSEIVTSINGHRDLEIRLFSYGNVTPEHRSVFAENSESVDRGCTIGHYDRKVNSGMRADRVDSSVSYDVKNKNEDLSEAGCSSVFGAAGPSRKLCDLALVTA